ncbi:MAG: response regulator [Gomphosphaeria aponina SAG 52.96 = DSM 107014]|uniref:Response regulator n=1 Tax=Gomphosphaeria aponina SAG 52.96 = DSM 107014 TaxID=1521640 RepID=A0A941GSY6_9CHRO|nr:response regulator [Gomphosphaeria aponina SAG 52.96 = DSM 107014]
MTTQKILVIDDTMVIRRMVKDMLPQGKFEVLEAKDGQQGLDLIRTAKPDLIMLDFILPKMSGWDVYQAIQKEHRFKTIPLVIMSGRKEEVKEKISEPFEYFAFVDKPFDQRKLFESIKEAILKSKKHPKVQDIPVQDTAPSDHVSAEIKALNQKIATMQTEIDGLKKQLNQLVQFIRQKLK